MEAAHDESSHTFEMQTQGSRAKQSTFQAEDQARQECIQLFDSKRKETIHFHAVRVRTQQRTAKQRVIPHTDHHKGAGGLEIVAPCTCNTRCEIPLDLEQQNSMCASR
jgi:hypothetical protein